MIMEWIADPTIWFGLFTLVILEIVLGIDNLIFIAILTDKLPPSQRNKARIIGLSSALIMRIILLISISWIITLTQPWITILGQLFSGRNIILLLGGLFLLFKATIELHDRLESHNDQVQSKTYASFWSIIIQIIILDAVFSLDSVITALGIADQLSIMILAIIIAVFVMIIASKHLTLFVNQHPTLIVLCLGFLLLIGSSLIAEGLSFHIPKGYLYTAIGFSALVEFFNQLIQLKRNKKLIKKETLRMRISAAVLRLLKTKTEFDMEELSTIARAGSTTPTFNIEERNMTSSVLSLADLAVQSIMTLCNNLHFIDIEDNIETIKKKLFNSPFSRIIVVKNKWTNNRAYSESQSIDYIGFIQKKDVLNSIINGTEISISSLIKQPFIISDNQSVLDILSTFKKQPIQIAFVVNKLGDVEGIVTLTDIMEAIAGDIPE